MYHDDELHRRMEEGISNLCVPAGAGAGGVDEECFTIVRLPSHVRAANKGLYEPRLVSIGPYHLASASTRGMQGHKWRFLRDFLLRCPGAGAGGLAACVREARALEARARRCYGEPLEIGSDDFVQMLVLDGCFVLEFLLKWGGGEAAELDAYMQWAWIYVHYDLLLVENQIPFFVIAKLFDLATAVDQRLLDLVCRFFSLHEPLCHAPAPSQLAVHHLLHLQYQRMVATTTPERRGLRRRSRWTRFGASLYAIRTGTISASTRARVIGAKTPLAIPCVTELQGFGVAFREKASPGSLFDVTFRGGAMEIPRLAINAGTRILLANLLALEQAGDWKEGVVSSYVVLMNALVNTAADVAVLQRRGILDNMLSNEEAAAAFFNRLGGCALFDPRAHHYARLFKDANEYCNYRWNRYVAVLKRDYLRTPCGVINLIVAATLLCISVMSAGFLICRYRHACP
ncbi:hypothetical protein ACP4OV_017871 [Aristida adscensionis]